MDIFHFLTLIGGLCLFLFGMNLMGQALERRAEWGSQAGRAGEGRRRAGRTRRETDGGTAGAAFSLYKQYIPLQIIQKPSLPGGRLGLSFLWRTDRALTAADTP